MRQRIFTERFILWGLKFYYVMGKGSHLSSCKNITTFFIEKKETVKTCLDIVYLTASYNL